MRRGWYGIGFALGLYGLWWAYVICFLYGKEYDNNAAGAWAAAGIASLTALLLLIYAVGLATAAVRNKEKRMSYLLAMLLLLIPVLGVAAFELLR